MAVIPALAAGFMAAAPTVAAVAGGAAAIKSIFDKPKTPSINQAPPSSPNPAASLAKANEEVARRRKMSLLSGGQTDLTYGTGLLKSSDVGKATLG